MSEPVLDVYLSGRLAGTITMVTRGRHRLPQLSYTDDWLSIPHAYPLSLSLPLSEQPSNPKRTENYLRSLLPENTKTLEDWQRRFRIPDMTDTTAILAVMGQDVAGAATIVAHGAQVDATRRRTELTEEDVASLIADLREFDGALPHTPDLPRVSLAGQQPKIGLYHDENGWWQPMGDLPSTHILKPVPERLSGADINEASMLRAAALLGIEASQGHVQTIGGESVFVSKRFDRIRDPVGEIQRIHQEDFIQSLGLSSSQKYQKTNGPTLKTLTTLIRDTSTDPTGDLDKFNKLLAFNVAIGNADAHAKNHSLFITPGGNELAPAYDLLSVTPYPAYDQELAFSIGRQYNYRNVTENDWRRYATVTGQDVDRVLDTVSEVWELTPDAVATALDDYNAPAQIKDGILDLTATLTHRAPGKTASNDAAIATDISPTSPLFPHSIGDQLAHGAQAASAPDADDGQPRLENPSADAGPEL